MLLVPQGPETDFAVGLSNGDIYLYDASGARRWRTPSNKMYFDAGKSDDLLVSSNGHVVAFAVNDDDARICFRRRQPESIPGTRRAIAASKTITFFKQDVGHLR